ncbi:MAG: hypothetical protein ACRD44_16660, partial [Bryobacteraceae bacterium]
DAVLTRYAEAIQRYLAESGQAMKVISKLENDLATGRYVIVFRPETLTAVRSFRVEGNRVVSVESLTGVLKPVLAGLEFTPSGVERILRLNVTPLYEERGYLEVAYPRMSMDAAGELTIAVREGATRKLGRVEIAGDQLNVEALRAAAAFRYGELANWKLVVEATDRLLGVLRRDGYITASAETERMFREKEPVVDVQLFVRRGPRFSFGRLLLEGLPATVEAEARTLWKLEAGAPMNPELIVEFVRAVIKLPSMQEVGNKTIASGMQKTGDPTTVDVRVSFK